MLNRRALLYGALSVALAPLAAEAQQAGKVYQVGYLFSGSFDDRTSHLETFRNTLRHFGYIEGQNIGFHYRFAENKLALLPSQAVELLRLNVDVIVAAGTPSAMAARKATTTVPIVLAHVGDPVGAGLIASLAQPGGNITGSALLVPELSKKRVELLTEAVPGLSRIAVMWNPLNPAAAGGWKETEATAQLIGLPVQPLPVRAPDEVADALNRVALDRSAALIVVLDSLTLSQRKRIANLAGTRRLPTMFDVREFVQDGGLISYGPSFHEFYRRAAVYVDKILKGAKPADLPVEQATKLELVINLKTARALGLTIPPSLLLRADQVIE